MPDNEISQPGEPPPAKQVAYHNAQSRYVVERCPGGGSRAVYAVLDMTRIVTHRVICRTNFADANMIRDALEKVTRIADPLYEEAMKMLPSPSMGEILNAVRGQ